MKESKVTGIYIYNEINRVKKEVVELQEALDLVGDEVGIGNIAYKLLKEQYQLKIAELKILESKVYTLCLN